MKRFCIYRSPKRNFHRIFETYFRLDRLGISSEISELQAISRLDEVGQRLDRLDRSFEIMELRETERLGTAG